MKILFSLRINLILILICLFFFTPSFAEDDNSLDIDSILDKLALELIEKYEPFLKKHKFPADAELLIFPIMNYSTQKRWKLSTWLESQLAAKLGDKSNFRLIPPQKMRQFIREHWNSLINRNNYEASIYASRQLATHLVISGFFNIKKDIIELNIQLIDPLREIILVYLITKFPLTVINSNLLIEKPLYNDISHLEIARNFIEFGKYNSAQKELKKVTTESYEEYWTLKLYCI